MNRIDQYAYDAKGNVTKHTYPDLNTDQYTYNSYSEVTQHTDANNNTSTYTYDGGSKASWSIKDPLNNLTTTDLYRQWPDADYCQMPTITRPAINTIARTG